MQLSLDEIASLCTGKLVGDGSKIISNVSSVENATPDDLIFIKDSKYKKDIASTKAGAIIINEIPQDSSQQNFIVVDNPQLAFVTVAEQFNSSLYTQAGIGKSTALSESAIIGENVSIGNFVSVGENVRIGNDVYIGSGTQIADNCVIGSGTVIFQNVVIGRNCHVGAGCRIHPGVVIGADGFGLVKDKVYWRRIPQLGNVVIGDNVDIGANTTIDRGTLDDTVISEGVKLDNLIQIGHNVRIGPNTVIAAHTAIAGSSRIGANCEIGGCVGIMDHSTVGDNILIGGGSVISGNYTKPAVYSSSVKAEELSIWKKNAAWIRKLYKLAERVKKLEEK